MLPSARLYLNPNDIYGDPLAMRRAKWLVDDVREEVEKSPELVKCRAECPESDETPDNAWSLVAQVAATHPRMLAWLAEGRVNWYWNVFGFWIGALRAIPGLGEIVWRLWFKPVARYAPWRLELHEALLQVERWKCNRTLDKARLDTKLAKTDTPGLSAMTDVAMIMRTTAHGEVLRKIEKMSSGCIGVSGLRGAGKSAVIRDFCSWRYGTPTWPEPQQQPTWSGSPLDHPGNKTMLPGLRLMIHAPLLYDAREFLIHLYTCLCRTVLADVRLNPTSFKRHALFALLIPRSIRPGTVLRGLSGIALLVATGVLAYRAAAGDWPTPTWSTGTWALLGAIAAAVAAATVYFRRTREALLEVRQLLALAADAQRRLERLHFQRTDTRSRGGALKGPMGSGVNLSSSQAFVEQMMTLPELIDDYRDFTERVVAAIQEACRTDRKKAKVRANGDQAKVRTNGDQANVRLVVGIDEMDQIENAQGASGFLNELSSVFGIPYCVYLIAVSPDTLAATDRRLVPLKTSSGGIFDEMVWVEPLDLAGSGDLLDRRVIGLPAAFVALCYVLSGGLPRDLLRVARAIFTSRQVSDEIYLSAAADAIVRDEIRALKHRAMAHAASLNIPAPPGLLEKLGDETWPIATPPIEMDTILDDLNQLWAGNARHLFSESGKKVAPLTAEVCDSFLAGLYFLLTVYQLFHDEQHVVTGLATQDVNGACMFKKDGDSALRGLARARIALGTNPYLASSVIDKARMTLCRAGYKQFTPGVEPRFLKDILADLVQTTGTSPQAGHDTGTCAV